MEVDRPASDPIGLHVLGHNRRNARALGKGALASGQAVGAAQVGLNRADKRPSGPAGSRAAVEVREREQGHLAVLAAQRRSGGYFVRVDQRFLEPLVFADA
jgi:hypothetical protein